MAFIDDLKEGQMTIRSPRCLPWICLTVKSNPLEEIEEVGLSVRGIFA